MNFITLFLIAVSLSMDAFAISLTIGMTGDNIGIKQGLKVGAFFGIFQGLMPISGYFLAQNFSTYIENYSKLIAFILLLIIGGKMIFEAFSNKDCEEPKYNLSFGKLTVLAIATSIDALAIGVTFSAINVNIYTSALLIAFVTFIISFLGVLFGKKCNGSLGDKAEIIGGIVLVLIGLKILIF